MGEIVLIGSQQQNFRPQIFEVYNQSVLQEWIRSATYVDPSLETTARPFTRAYTTGFSLATAISSASIASPKSDW